MCLSVHDIRTQPDPTDRGDPLLEYDREDSPSASRRRGAGALSYASSTVGFVCKQLLFLLTGFAFGGICFVVFHRFANVAVRTVTGVNMQGTREEIRAKNEAEAARIALDEVSEAKRRAAFRRHHGGSDDPHWFTGRLGGPLEGGGEDWQDKLPAELQHITTRPELARKVVWASRTSIMEIASGRIWQRVGDQWLQVFEATAGKRKAPAGDPGAAGDAVETAYRHMKAELQRKAKLLELFEKEEELRRIRQEKEDKKLVAVLKGKMGASSKSHLGPKVWAICSRPTPGSELVQLCDRLKRQNAIGVTVDELKSGGGGNKGRGGVGAGGGRGVVGGGSGGKAARISDDIKAAIKLSAKNLKVAERVVELCLAAPKGGELRELCYRWSVQRLPNYPQDKAKSEEEYWIQHDIERMNNRTAAVAAERSSGGWWAKLRGNANGAEGKVGATVPAPPPPSPPFDWGSFPWAEDPDKDLPDSEAERIERLEEKAMMEEGKANEEGWDAGPEGGGIAGTDAVTTNADGGDEEGEEPDTKQGKQFPAGTRWGATDEEEGR